jgi:hypothetical protein
MGSSFRHCEGAEAIHEISDSPEPRPRDPVPVRAAITVAFISVLIFNDRQLDRLRHHLRSQPVRRLEGWSAPSRAVMERDAAQIGPTPSSLRLPLVAVRPHNAAPHQTVHPSL